MDLSKLFDSLYLYTEIKDAMTTTQLKKLAEEVGADLTGLKSTAAMEEAIAKAIWEKEHPGEPMPLQISPMLMHDITSEGKDYVDKTFKKGEWGLQQKINGQRFILVLYPDGTTRMTSRAKSVKTLRFSELDDHVLGLLNLKSPFKDGVTVWDGEIIMKKAEIDLPSGVHTTSTLQSTVSLMHLNSKQSLEVQEREGSLTYKVFDILYLNGENVEKKPYKERAELVATSVAAMKELNPYCSMEVVPLITDFESAWDSFYKYVHEEGGEGLVLKKLSAPYEQGKRTKNQWKLKGYISIDAFVTGWTPSTPGRGNENYIGGFEFSTNYEGKVVPLCAVASLDMETRKDATIYDENGKPTLNPKYLGRCAEIVAQDMNKKTRRLNSARILSWRDDKTPDDCVMLEEQIKYNTSIE